MKFDRRTLTGLACTCALLLPQIASAACNANIPADNPDSRYQAAADVVTDVATGLMWKKCSEGQSGATCGTGTPTAVTWQDALKFVQTVNAAGFGGYSDWRLPNRAELASLVERKCVSPAINEAIFPGTPSARYWSSSPSARNADYAWQADFNSGDVFAFLKTGQNHVRLVRAGQQ